MKGNFSSISEAPEIIDRWGISPFHTCFLSSKSSYIILPLICQRKGLFFFLLRCKWLPEATFRRNIFTIIISNMTLKNHKNHVLWAAFCRPTLRHHEKEALLSCFSRRATEVHIYKKLLVPSSVGRSASISSVSRISWANTVISFLTSQLKLEWRLVPCFLLTGARAGEAGWTGWSVRCSSQGAHMCVMWIGRKLSPRSDLAGLVPGVAAHCPMM